MQVVELLQAAAAEDPEFQGDRALLRAVYNWMQKNVRYAYGKGATRHTAGNTDAAGVLQRRRGTSAGFSALVAALCEVAHCARCA